MTKIGLILAFVTLNFLYANPFPDKNSVPKDLPEILNTNFKRLAAKEIYQNAKPVLRVDLKWNKAADKFKFLQAQRELSGTESFAARSKKKDSLGSYQARLIDSKTNLPIAFQSLGTGMEFRTLSRGLSFRFPDPKKKVKFTLHAENPRTGKMDLVVAKEIEPKDVRIIPKFKVPQVWQIKKAKKSPSLRITIYADGYLKGSERAFKAHAAKVSAAFKRYKLPLYDHIELVATFSSSKIKLPRAKPLQSENQIWGSFLSLYYPYWRKFGRWYHVVYPTNFQQYRDRLAQVPYDYPLILIDSSAYWGVGNFRELTAIPSRSSSFAYLLVHEFGHYMGLNEEYESGGPTELRFAPGIDEPWSQNITFQTSYNKLKWKKYVKNSTPIPTPVRHWNGNGAWGAYKGGYAQSDPKRRSHKPGLRCAMRASTTFCPICLGALEDRIKFDMGM